MSQPHSDDAGWIGFHLFIAAPYEPFLTGCLLPLVKESGRTGAVRRLFFLRYSEGGDHLRLRLLPQRGSADIARTLLRRRVEAWAREDFRLEEHPYDREALYFGETRASVYSELLNEATSQLALRLAAAPGSGNRPRRWLALATALRLLMQRAAEDQAEFRADLDCSIAFAGHVAAVAGTDLGAAERAGPAVDHALSAAIERLGPVLATDAAMAHAARLLRRARRYAPAGDRVAAHALHLLCNKLGFFPHEEHELFSALARLADSDSQETA